MLLRLPLALAFALSFALPAKGETITVFAAASLKTALDAVAEDWAQASGHVAVLSYGGSAALAKQIQNGAPADVFLSASPEWMEALAADGLILPDTRRDLLGNRLVLVAHDPATPPLTVTPETDLAALLAGGRLAMGMVDSVPAGQYGKAALERLGLWPQVADLVAQAENVRAALDLVAQGEAPLGIVYATDAHAAGNTVTVIATFPEDSHPPIRYPVAAMTDSAAAARDFLEFLTSAPAAARFSEQGFLLLPG